MSEPTLFDYRKIPNEERSAYTLEILNDERKVILTVPEVRAIHVQAVLKDDVAFKLIDMGYENPQFTESL
jgi:hypothetical protein